MKKTVGSLFGWSRRNFVLLGVVLSLVGLAAFPAAGAGAPRFAFIESVSEVFGLQPARLGSAEVERSSARADRTLTPSKTAVNAKSSAANKWSDDRSPEAIGFSGAWAPGTWTFSNGGNSGSVNTGGAPGSISLTSGDAGGGGSNADFTHPVTFTGTISFNWSYVSSDVSQACCDRPQYLVNGVATNLPGFSTGGGANQSGTASVAVNSGDTFGFRMFAIDSILGSATTTFSNFVAGSPCVSNPSFETGNFTNWTVINNQAGGSGQTATVSAGGASNGTNKAVFDVPGQSIGFCSTATTPTIRSSTITVPGGTPVGFDWRVLPNGDWAYFRAQLIDANTNGVVNTYFNQNFASTTAYANASFTPPAGDYYLEFQGGSTDQSCGGFVSAQVFVDNITPGCVPPATTPVVTAPANQTANEGTSTAFSLGSFVDPDGGPWTATINWGDATANTVFNPAAAGSLGTQNHTYAQNGVYTVTITVADSGALSDSDTFQVTVSNVAPSGVTVAMTPGTINENGSSSLSGSFTDPGTQDTHTVTINWGDGSANTVLNLGAGVTTIPSTPHTYLDDNPTGTPSDIYTVNVTVTDSFPASGMGSTSVTVNNVAPSNVMLNLSAPTINEGQSTSLSGSFTDPGTLDTHTVTINWGDGSAPQVLNLAAGVTTIPSTPHTYLDDNPTGTSSDVYTITVTVADDDLGTAVRPQETIAESSIMAIPLRDWNGNLIGRETREIRAVSYENVSKGTIFDANPHAIEGLISGTTASTTMGSGFGTNIQNTVNGVGLSATTLTANHDPTIPTNSWVSSGTLTGNIDFNLNGSFSLSGFSFWNQNGGGPGAAGITGIQNVTVSTSIDGVTFTPVPGGPTQFAQVTAAVPVGPQVISFAPVTASFVRFAVTSNWGDPAQTGFAEVQFNGGGGSTTVTVNNVNPTATFSNGGPYVCGQDGMVSFTNQADPSAADLAGLRYSYDFDNNGTWEVGDGTWAGSPGTMSSATVPSNPYLMPVGTHTVKGRIMDDDLGFTDYTTVITVVKAPTTTTVVSSLNPSIYGQNVTFTATVVPTTVYPSSPLPSGTVSFNIDGIIYCPNTPLANVGGVMKASCTQAGLPALGAGTRVVVPIYSGDGCYNPSAGTLAGGQVVNKANTATAITSDSPDPSLVNQPYPVTWTVVPSPVYPGSTTPTGTVTVNGGTGGGSCTAPVAAGGCSLTPTTVGTKTIQATYNGDANYNTSMSATTTHDVHLQITGTVRNGLTLAPVAGHPVFLFQMPAGTQIGSTTTNASGVFTFAAAYTGDLAMFPADFYSEPFVRFYNAVTTNITGADFLIYGSEANFPRKVRFPTQFVVPGAAGSMPVMMNSLGNEASISFSFTYDINPFAQPPVVVCGANAPGCTITQNNSIFGKVGVTITPAGGGFTRPEGADPEAAGPNEIARINFQTVASATMPSTDFTIGDSPTPRSATETGTINSLLAIYVIPARIVFAHGLEGDVAGRNAGNGVVDSGDVTQVRRFVTGLDTPVGTHNEFQRTDVAPASTKGDGTLNATDVIQTRRYGAGLDTAPSAGGAGAPAPPPVAPAPEAAVAGGREVKIGSSNASTNSRVSIPVDLTASGDEIAASFTVRYDETRLTAPRVDLAKDAPEGMTLTVNTDEPGLIRVLVDSTTAIGRNSKDALSLLNITFDVTRSAPSGDTTVELDDLVISDSEARSLAAKATSGTLSISGPNPTDTKGERPSRRQAQPDDEWDIIGEVTRQIPAITIRRRSDRPE